MTIEAPTPCSPPETLVALAAELAAGVESRHNRFQRRFAGFVVSVHGDASTVVYDRHGAVSVDPNVDRRGKTRHRFVDAVVDDLAHEVEDAFGTGRADVHPGSFTDRLKALHDGDVVGRVVCRTSVSVAVGRDGRFCSHRSPSIQIDQALTHEH